MLRTAAILLGVLIIVAGVTLMLVTGLDPTMVALGLLIIAGGAYLIWSLSRAADSAAPAETLTGGRSFQKTLPPTEKRNIDRRL